MLTEDDLNRDRYPLLTSNDTGAGWDFQCDEVDMLKLHNSFESFYKSGGCSLPIFASGMGTGKSRTLTEVPRLFKKWFPNVKDWLIVVNVSLENDSVKDASSIAVRMMWQLKGQVGNFDEFMKDWRGIEVENVAEAICNTAKKDSLILLLVDGVHNIDLEEGSYQESNMKTLLDTLSSAMRSKDYKLFPVVSATVSHAVREAMKDSLTTFNGVLMHPPRLTKMPRGIQQHADRAMSLTLGHPRAMEAIANIKESRCSFKDLCDLTKFSLAARYGMKTPDPKFRILLGKCFKALTKEEISDLDPTMASGFMTVSRRKDSEGVLENFLEIAPLWLAIQKSLGSTILRNWDCAPSMNAQDFEVFVSQFLSIRSEVLSQDEMPLGDIHFGIDWDSDIEDLKFFNRALYVAQSTHQISSASEWKAAKINECAGKWTINDGKVRITNECVLNAKGASSADLFYRISEENTFSVSCKLQEKEGNVLTLNEKKLEKNTLNSVSSGDIHVIMTNKVVTEGWKHVLQCCLPPECTNVTFGVVDGINFKKYFGPFAPFWTAHMNPDTNSESD